MSKCIGISLKDAVRVQVVKYVAELPTSETKRFSVDPQITTFDVLQNLLARAFEIQGDFIISYLTRDIDGCARYCPLISDWDLDAAFLDSDPSLGEQILQLRVDLINKPIAERFEEKFEKSLKDRPSLKGTILNQIEKSFSLMQRAFNFGDHGPMPASTPLTDAKFHIYLDGNGEVIAPQEFRKTVFHSGVEPVLRKVVWKHLLNVYPSGLTAKERISYMKQKALEYHQLKSTWEAMVSTTNEELRQISNMVRKDVLRTDRTHSFYAGADDNTNLKSLFNILITYSLNHPSVSYCQGMSDLASPILMTMKDEAHAYVCFCALMQRLKTNFSTDGITMTLKFQHLQELVEYYDPEYYDYLQRLGAAELLFCYRWLLLELKREFAFDDALYMLEVLWSSLIPKPPQHGLPLWEIQFNPKTQHLHPRVSPFSKVRTIRKHNSFSSIRNVSHQSSEESTSSSNETLNSFSQQQCNNNCDKPPKRRLQRASKSDDVSDSVAFYNTEPSRSNFQETALKEEILEEEEETEVVGKRPNSSEYKLPSPNEMGSGSPFMIFLCLTILLQHRDAVMRTCLDSNEIAMYFDKLVRKHNVHQVLHQARGLFKQYLQEEENADLWNDPKV